MQFHAKFNEVRTLVNASIPVLLTGEKGSGKTTLAKQVAEDCKMRFFSMSMTRQTTLSHLLGFMSVNGTYVASQLRDCAENGGAFLLDEIDAADANVLLSLNTIENGFISFPNGLVDLHKDFRLMATSNPQDEHQHYTGRTKLDAATLDRFDIIDIERDENLEQSLVDPDTFRRVSLVRTVLRAQNSSKTISMRDSMRYQQRKELELLDGFVYRLMDKNDLIFEKYEAELENLPKHSNQSECKTFDELLDLAKVQGNNPKTNKGIPMPGRATPQPYTTEYENEPSYDT